jgi:hypothetical protein
VPKSWDDATPQEILEARVQHLEEGLNWLKECVSQALRQTETRMGSPVRPEDVLDEEWPK